MASDSFRKRLEEVLSCSICWKYYNNPYILDCGHNFCLGCVSRCWMEFHDYTACPQCRTVVERKNCLQNTVLGNVVEIIKKLSGPVKEKRAGEKICKNHPGPYRTLYCQNDDMLFCRVCEESQQHEGHDVAFVEDFVRIYKDHFCHCIEELKRERAKMVKGRLHLVVLGEQLQRDSVTEYQAMGARFRQLHEFLTSQEDTLFKHLKLAAGGISDEKNHDLAHLNLHIFTLENNIRLLEEKVSQPAYEFLQDFMKIFDRYQKRPKLLNVEKISRGLRWKIWDLMETSAMITGLTNHFTDTLRDACSVKKANVTLDSNSNHPQLLLSSDGKSMKWTPNVAQLTNSGQRFERLFCAVGCQEFKVGRYVWDVTLKGQGEWAVGIVKSSARRKGFFNLSVSEGFFAVGELEKQYKIINVPITPVLHRHEELRWIRVSLNCSGGQVSFYDVSRAKRLFGFDRIGCFQETFLPFFWLKGRNIQLIINH